MARFGAPARWFSRPADPVALGLAGLTVVALVMLAFSAAIGLHPGLNLAFACALLAVLAWSTLGLRAAVGEPDLGRWTRLVELAQVKGAIAAVDLDETAGRRRTALAERLPGAKRHTIAPASRVSLMIPDTSCDAVVIDPAVAALDETARVALLDEARRVLRVGGRLVLVVPTAERRGWLWIAPIEWQPGAPPGWWSEALAERFEEVRHAPLSRRLDVLLARRADAGEG